MRPQADDADTDDQSEIAHSEASTSAAWAPSLHEESGSKRARQLMEAVQRSRPDRLTKDILEAKVAADASSPAHNLRSHASRSPQPAVRSHLPSIRSPHRENVQMKMVSFSVQTRTPGARRPGTTPESYIKQAIDNGDAADLLRVSCALGFMLSEDGAQVEPHEAMSYIDDAVMAATKALRSISVQLAPIVKELLFSGEEKVVALLDLILISGLKGIRGTRRLQRSGSLTSFLYHEVAAHEAPVMDTMARVCFCLCLWAFIRDLLGDQRKPTLQASCSVENNEDFWISIRYSNKGSWRHFYPSERGVREMMGDLSSAGALVSASQPLTPLQLIGVLLQRFWAAALAAAAKRPSTGRHASPTTTSGFCSKWLSHVLEFDREKGLGLSQSQAFVSSIRAALQQGRLEDRCLPALLALVARHAEERADVPLSPFRSGGERASSKHRELWAAFEALGALLAASNGGSAAGGGVGVAGSGGSGMTTKSVMCAADQVGESSDAVMSRAHAALRRGFASRI